MTLSNTTSQTTAHGDGLTTIFTYDFPVPSASFAMLTYTDATGATSSISSSLFSMTGVGPTSSGGTFTYPLAGSAISTGTSLTLQRTVPLTQDAAIGNQGNFYPATVEGALDYETMALQQLQREIDSLASTVATFTTGSLTSVTTGMIAAGAVTYPKIQNVAASSLVGNPTTSSATMIEIPLGGGLAFSGGSLTCTVVTSSTAVTLIGTITTGVATASFTFSSIASTYRDLEIRIRGRGTNAANESIIRMQINGDTGSNYNSQRGYFFANTMFAGEALGAASAMLGAIPGANATANYAGGFVAAILGYTNSSFFKSFNVYGSESYNTSTQDTPVYLFGGIWLSTSTVTSITIFPQTGSFATGSIASLYGYY